MTNHKKTPVTQSFSLTHTTFTKQLKLFTFPCNLMHFVQRYSSTQLIVTKEKNPTRKKRFAIQQPEEAFKLPLNSLIHAVKQEFEFWIIISAKLKKKKIPPLEHEQVLHLLHVKENPLLKTKTYSVKENNRESVYLKEKQWCQAETRGNKPYTEPCFWSAMRFPHPHPDLYAEPSLISDQRSSAAKLCHMMVEQSF